eukprot:CAMPEP_0171479118 /NCGR_PEP_ID=MMETSP0946-20130122/5201_1 /TAXON_ID=109269 /ORGANISM="Vaucheria litorea, Strain CCMP2940" /LENGTH=93 /DNA_ID=CAMNT_0012009921 /DNA_START=28 /DNA_END=309 /DNA_ORIENTATION=+
MKKAKPGVLTQKYDMGTLKKLNELEDWAFGELAKNFYDCSQEDLDVELDIHEVHGLSEDERRDKLKQLLVKSPKDVGPFIDDLLKKMNEISED